MKRRYIIKEEQGTVEGTTKKLMKLRISGVNTGAYA